MLEELTSYTIFHFTSLFVCCLSPPLYNMQYVTEKAKFITGNTLSPWPRCVTQSQPNSRWSQDLGIPQPFAEGFHWKESWELGLTYAWSSHYPFLMRPSSRCYLSSNTMFRSSKPLSLLSGQRWKTSRSFSFLAFHASVPALRVSPAIKMSIEEN